VASLMQRCFSTQNHQSDIMFALQTQRSVHASANGPSEVYRTNAHSWRYSLRVNGLKWEFQLTPRQAEAILCAAKESPIDSRFITGQCDDRQNR